jgi:hypothetical protein
MLASAVVATLGAGCKRQAPTDGTPPVASASATPIDRLSPDELGPSAEELFGLPVPRGLAVSGKFEEVGIASGRVSADAVANFVREHVEVERVEIGAARTIFPAARIKNGARDRVYLIEVLSDGAATRLTVRDVTPPPPPPPRPQNVTNEELWRRAGFSRDGKPLNVKALE